MLPAVLIINPVSQWQRGFLLAIHCVTAVSVWFLTWPIALLLTSIVLASLVWQWRKKPALQSVQCLPDGQFEAITPSGEVLPVTLSGSSVLTAQVLVLHFIAAQQRFYLVLWPDSADAEVLRQWRIYLRWVWPAQIANRQDLNSLKPD